jgi:MarR family transcriptional regulator, 2-MHQ and catechol-resistance regulon repressor
MTKHPSFLQGLGYPVEKPAPAAEALYGVVWMAGRAQRRVAKALKPFALTPVKLNYLMIVRHIGKEAGLSQREIARRVLIDAGNATHVLDDLEKKGWVVRRPGPDRRSKRIKITPKGASLLDQAWPEYKKALNELTRGLAVSEQNRLVEILSGWRESLEG